MGALHQLNSRSSEFDSIRGIAAFGVVWYHIRKTELFWYWTSMDLFFVLSSFLIGRLILRNINGWSDVSAFYLRRAVRLWPGYLITVVGIYAIQQLFVATGHGPQHSSDALFRFLTFSQYTELYYSPRELWDYPKFAIHLWTLGVEEQFYILFPVAFLLLRHAGLWVTSGLFVLGILSGVLARMQGLDFHLLAHHVDAFFLGSGLALGFAFVRRHERWFRMIFPALGLLGFGLALPYLIDGYQSYPGNVKELNPLTPLYFSLLWTSMIGWVALNSGSPGLGWLRHPLPVYLGRISYSLYLVHLPILALGSYFLRDALVHFFGLHIARELCAVASLPAVFLVAHGLYRWIDKPLQEAGAVAALPQQPDRRPESGTREPGSAPTRVPSSALG
ncbi:MAG: acyltransferase [Stagnimonas sp.]|nr:acyltransferase [Stagnimonas sp.]